MKLLLRLSVLCVLLFIKSRCAETSVEDPGPSGVASIFKSRLGRVHSAAENSKKSLLKKPGQKKTNSFAENFMSFFSLKKSPKGTPTSIPNPFRIATKKSGVIELVLDKPSKAKPLIPLDVCNLYNIDFVAKSYSALERGKCGRQRPLPGVPGSHLSTSVSSFEFGATHPLDSSYDEGNASVDSTGSLDHQYSVPLDDSGVGVLVENSLYSPGEELSRSDSQKKERTSSLLKRLRSLRGDSTKNRVVSTRASVFGEDSLYSTVGPSNSRHSLGDEVTQSPSRASRRSISLSGSLPETNYDVTTAPTREGSSSSASEGSKAKSTASGRERSTNPFELSDDENDEDDTNKNLANNGEKSSSLTRSEKGSSETKKSSRDTVQKKNENLSKPSTSSAGVSEKEKSNTLSDEKEGKKTKKRKIWERLFPKKADKVPAA